MFCFQNHRTNKTFFPNILKYERIINSENEEEALNKWEQYASTRHEKNNTLQVQTDAYENQQVEFNPSRMCVHKIFVMYNVFAGICAGLLGLGQFLGEFSSSHQYTIHGKENTGS